MSQSPLKSRLFRSVQNIMHARAATQCTHKQIHTYKYARAIERPWPNRPLRLHTRCVHSIPAHPPQLSNDRGRIDRFGFALSNDLGRIDCAMGGAYRTTSAESTSPRAGCAHTRRHCTQADEHAQVQRHRDRATCAQTLKL